MTGWDSKVWNSLNLVQTRDTDAFSSEIGDNDEKKISEDNQKNPCEFRRLLNTVNHQLGRPFYAFVWAVIQ